MRGTAPYIPHSNGTISVAIVLSPAGYANSACCGDIVENICGCLKGALVMGKYFLGWIMGVPVIVLVIVYFLFH
jgi:hypothetical protein